MFNRKGIMAECIKCKKLNKIHSGKNLVVGNDKVSIEFKCSCGQHNVMHLQVVRRRVDKQTPAVNVKGLPKDVPNMRTSVTPFDGENSEG